MTNDRYYSRKLLTCLVIVFLFILIPIFQIRTGPVLEIEEWCENNNCKLTLQCGGPHRWKRVFLSIDDFIEKLDENNPEEVFYSLCAGYTYFFYTKTTMYGIKGVEK